MVLIADFHWILSQWRSLRCDHTGFLFHIPCLSGTFFYFFFSPDSRTVVSCWWKYVYWILVNRWLGLGLSRKKVVKLTDHSCSPWNSNDTSFNGLSYKARGIFCRYQGGCLYAAWEARDSQGNLSDVSWQSNIYTLGISWRKEQVPCTCISDIDFVAWSGLTPSHITV